MPGIPSISLETKKATLAKRAAIVSALRRFFGAEGFLEVETPLRVVAPAPELHLQCLPSAARWLVPSPELQMKRLLAAGYGPIFQISKAFRAGERGRLHCPEFTMLEWYRPGADYRALMDDLERLVRATAQAVRDTLAIRYQGEPLDLGAAWERLTVKEAFRRYAGWEPDSRPDEHRFTVDLVDRVEPRLGRGRPTLLMDYPASMASLARLKPGDASVCERVELYLAGIEIANGFSELIDPDEQRRRFEADLAERLGTDQSYVSKYERAERRLDVIEVRTVCRALGLDFCGFMAGFERELKRRGLP